MRKYNSDLFSGEKKNSNRMSANTSQKSAKKK